MSGLQRFEQRLERAISGVFARTFRSAVQPVEIAAALQRELDNKAQIVSRQRRLVPNSFTVELSPSDQERLGQYETTLVRELTDQLQEHADLQNYVFPGPIRIRLVQADDLTTGRFRVLGRAEAKVTGREHTAPASMTRAVVEVNGTEHRLVPPGMIVGRGSEADLQIDDPGVSRKHAEFRVTAEAHHGGIQIEVLDSGSTNGIRVDGQKVPHAVLHDGSRVQIGHTSLVIRMHEEAPGV